MGKLKRVLLFLLVVCMLLSLASFAYADGSDKINSSDDTALDSAVENPPTDFILVFDCSASLCYTDKTGLCSAACRSFIDMQPAENTRLGAVSVVADTKAYSSFDFSDRFENLTENDQKYITEVLPLEYTSDVRAKESSKKTIQGVIDHCRRINTGGKTPLGLALAAAVEMLERAGSYDNNASIIIISDCDEDASDATKDMALVKEACVAANEHGWPVFTIGLTYSFNQYTAELKNAGKTSASNFLASIREYNNAAGFENGQVFECGDEGQVFDALSTIIGGVIDEAYPPCDVPFDVEPLTSEVFISVFGKDIKSITLTPPNGEQDIIITRDIEDRSKIVATVESLYTTARIICPKSGHWNLHVEGNNAVKVKISHGSLYEYSLQMTVANAENNRLNVTRNEKVSVSACLSYQDVELHNDSFYREHQSSDDIQLRIIDKDGRIIERNMSASDDDYYCELDISEFKTGEYKLQTVLKNSMFRSGVRISNSIYINVVNKPVAFKENYPAEITRTCYSNSPIGNIDLTEIFSNPDSDPLSYELTCNEDRSIKFSYDITPDGYIAVTAPNIEGNYKLSLSAKDNDMSAPLVYDGIKLEIVNREVEALKIPRQEIWTDKFLFQEKTVGAITMDMHEYFSDPDGAELSFSFTTKEGNIVAIENTDGGVAFAPLSKGTELVTVTASDGISEVSKSFKIDVVSGQASFWKHNWIKFVIAAAILIALIITVIIILKNKRVHGEWNFTFDENGDRAELENINISTNTANGRKMKFYLTDMLLELVPYLDNSTQWSVTIPKYFEVSGVSKIELIGVNSARGCIINKLPKSSDIDVRVTWNGADVRRKTKISQGNLRISINDPGGSGSQFEVNMRLN